MFQACLYDVTDVERKEGTEEEGWPSTNSLAGLQLSIKSSSTLMNFKCPLFIASLILQKVFTVLQLTSLTSNNS
jgi:hypothetical protein